MEALPPLRPTPNAAPPCIQVAPLVAGRSRSQVTAQAFLFGGGKKEDAGAGAASSFYICIDCGCAWRPPPPAAEALLRRVSRRVRPLPATCKRRLPPGLLRRRFIYDGDFKKAPSSYKCPACNSPKSRSAGERDWQRSAGCGAPFQLRAVYTLAPPARPPRCTHLHASTPPPAPAPRFKVFKGKVQGKVNNTGAAMQKRMKEKQW